MKLTTKITTSCITLLLWITMCATSYQLYFNTLTLPCIDFQFDTINTISILWTITGGLSGALVLITILLLIVEDPSNKTLEEYEQSKESLRNSRSISRYLTRGVTYVFYIIIFILASGRGLVYLPTLIVVTVIISLLFNVLTQHRHKTIVNNFKSNYDN